MKSENEIVLRAIVPRFSHSHTFHFISWLKIKRSKGKEYASIEEAQVFSKIIQPISTCFT